MLEIKFVKHLKKKHGDRSEWMIPVCAVQHLAGRAAPKLDQLTAVMQPAKIMCT